MILSDLLLFINYFILLYFVSVNGVYITLYAISLVEVATYTGRETFRTLPDPFDTGYAPPISLVVPAYNEEDTVVESVRSFLALDYHLHEVVLVNDGSEDNTLELLREAFDLYPSEQPIRWLLQTKPVHTVYQSATERLVVLDKENGGKADALNAGLCAASYPLACNTEADTFLEEDSLQKISRPLLKWDDAVAVGGIVRIANDKEFEHGRLVETPAPRKALPTFQVVEYLRAFISTRTAWGRLNALMIVSGAFGLFKRHTLIEAGGYAEDSVGEDMELATRLHHYMRRTGRRYHIPFAPDPVAWTMVPDTLGELRKQREHWHRGLLDTLVRHRRMFFNPRYGVVGLFGMPYYLIFEFLGPFVEIVGYLAFLTALFLGAVNLKFALIFFLVAFGLGSLLSLVAIFLEQLRTGQYHRRRDLAKLMLFGVLEKVKS